MSALSKVKTALILIVAFMVIAVDFKAFMMSAIADAIFIAVLLLLFYKIPDKKSGP